MQRDSAGAVSQLSTPQLRDLISAFFVLGTMTDQGIKDSMKESEVRGKSRESDAFENVGRRILRRKM